TIAMRIGRPTGARAVGRANGDNRIAIIVPCHRVIGADGSLTGYGGGHHRKRRLLELERRSPQMSFLAPDGNDGSLPLADPGGAGPPGPAHEHGSPLRVDCRPPQSAA